MFCVYDIINDLIDLIVTYLTITMAANPWIGHALKVVALNGQIKNHVYIGFYMLFQYINLFV